MVQSYCQPMPPLWRLSVQCNAMLLGSDTAEDGSSIAGFYLDECPLEIGSCYVGS